MDLGAPLRLDILDFSPRWSVHTLLFETLFCGLRYDGDDHLDTIDLADKELRKALEDLAL